MTTVSGTNKPRSAKAVCFRSDITFTYAGGETCTCNSDAAITSCSDGSYSATCPASISDFCTRMSSANKCPGDCRGKGLCLGVSGSKRCFCVYGWKGNDCDIANADETDDKLIPNKNSSPPAPKSSYITTVITGTFCLIAFLAI